LLKDLGRVPGMHTNGAPPQDYFVDLDRECA
jgi:hypothetical protein